MLKRKVYTIILSITLSLLQATSTLASVPLAQTMPAPELRLPAELGQILSSWQSPEHDKKVYLILDAHSSFESQKKIADIVSWLHKNRDVATVYEEGMEGDVPAREVFLASQLQIDETVFADYLTYAQRIGGAELAQIRGVPVNITGVEDWNLYLANIEAFREAIETQVALTQNLKEFLSLIQDLATQKGSSDLTLWIRHLRQKDEPAYSLHTELNFYKNLASKFLTEQEREEYLILKIMKKGENASNKLESAEWDASKWQSDLDQLKFLIQGRAFTEDERLILSYVEGLRGLMKVATLSSGIETFQKTQIFLEAFDTQIFKTWLRDQGQRLIVLNSQWEDMTDKGNFFYELALEREAVAATHVQEAMQERNETESAMVFGGFHREGLEKLFQERNISYQIIAPNFTLSDTQGQSRYEKRMLQEYPESIQKNDVEYLTRPLSDLAQMKARGRDYFDLTPAWRGLSSQLAAVKQESPHFSGAELFKLLERRLPLEKGRVLAASLGQTEGKRTGGSYSPARNAIADLLSQLTGGAKYNEALWVASKKVKRANKYSLDLEYFTHRFLFEKLLQLPMPFSYPEFRKQQTFVIWKALDRWFLGTPKRDGGESELPMLKPNAMTLIMRNVSRQFVAEILDEMGVLEAEKSQFQAIYNRILADLSRRIGSKDVNLATLQGMTQSELKAWYIGGDDWKRDELNDLRRDFLLMRPFSLDDLEGASDAFAQLEGRDGLIWGHLDHVNAFVVLMRELAALSESGVMGLTAAYTFRLSLGLSTDTFDYMGKPADEASLKEIRDTHGGITGRGLHYPRLQGALSSLQVKPSGEYPVRLRLQETFNDWGWRDLAISRWLEEAFWLHDVSIPDLEFLSNETYQPLEPEALDQFIRRHLSKNANLKMIPHLIQGKSDAEILNELKLHGAENQKVVRSMRRNLSKWIVLDVLSQFGSWPEVRQFMMEEYQKTDVERFIEEHDLDFLVEIFGGDLDMVREFFQTHGHAGDGEAAIKILKEGAFGDLRAFVKKSASTKKTSGTTVARLKQVYEKLSLQIEGNRLLAIKQLMRLAFYPLMRADHENQNEQHLSELKALVEKIDLQSQDEFDQSLRETYEFYRQARNYAIRGYNPDHDGVHEDLFPAQRYSVFEAVQKLQDPELRSVIIGSEARMGKTITAILAALNIVEADGMQPKRRILYTTKKSALHEAEGEITRRVAKDQGLHVFVLDRAEKNIEEQLELLGRLKANVLLLVNYESARDFAEILAEKYRPDVHIIDEIENLRRGEQTVRAPKIFGIPSKYRIAIAARLLVKSRADLVEPLLWTRQTLLSPQDQMRHEMGGWSVKQFYEVLDPVLVRWRRKAVFPEMQEPEFIRVDVPYSDQERAVIQMMRQHFGTWKQRFALPGKSHGKDHVFNRIHQEGQTGLDLSLVMPDAQLILTATEGQGEPIRIEVQESQVVIDGEVYDKHLDQVEGKIRLVSQSGSPNVVLSYVTPPSEIKIDEKLYLVTKEKMTALSSKVRALDQIIKDEFAGQGKVLVMLSSAEGAKNLERHYAEKYGAEAVGLAHRDLTPSERADLFWRYRSDPALKILIGTHYLLGSSLNLFQLPNLGFHNSTAVLMDRPWWIMDQGERLIGIGQDHPVKVHVLTSVFGEEDPFFKTVDQMRNRILEADAEVFHAVMDGDEVLGSEERHRIAGMMLEMMESGSSEHSASSLGAGWREHLTSTSERVNMIVTAGSLGRELSESLSLEQLRELITLLYTHPVDLKLVITDATLLIKDSPELSALLQLRNVTQTHLSREEWHRLHPQRKGVVMDLGKASEPDSLMRAEQSLHFYVPLKEEVGLVTLALLYAKSPGSIPGAIVEKGVFQARRDAINAIREAYLSYQVIAISA